MQYYYTQPIVEVKRARNSGKSAASRRLMQCKPIALAVQPAPHIRAPAAIIYLIAVADVSTRLGAISPNRMLNEPRKRLRKFWVEVARIDLGRNLFKHDSTAIWPITCRSV
ncbi:MAG: hypothetical protein WAM12_13055, partial [Pseudolabrys sp.]